MNDGEKVLKVLALIGQNEDLRNQFIGYCKKVEKGLTYPHGSVRDDITGPLIDALHAGQKILRKTLSNDVVFDFYYRSKIARDFVMSNPERPSHVWEPQTTRLLLYLSAHAKQVIVGGAYFGDQAILIAKQITGHEGICHAFEPNAEQFDMLKHNAELNKLNNLRMRRMGLWKDSGSHMQLVGEDSFAHPQLVQGGGGNEQSSDVFPTVAIDDYLEAQGIKSVDLIMLDIEGAEYGVLQGAARQLKLETDAAPNIVFEVHRSYVDWSEGLRNTEIVKYLETYGYSIFAVRDYNSNVDMQDGPIELIPAEDAYLEGPPHGFNMLAVKNVSLLKNDLFRLCRNVSPKLLLHKDPALHHPMS